MDLFGRDLTASSSLGPAGRLTIVLLGCALLLGIACGSSGSDAPRLDDPAQTGADLVSEYVTLVQGQDVDGLRAFISDAFIIQRADGSHSEKGAYLLDLPEVGPFVISEVTALQADSSLVVRWFIAVDEVIDGARGSGEPAPRLSTFVYQDGEWRLSSHANFNVPEPAPN